MFSAENSNPAINVFAKPAENSPWADSTPPINNMKFIIGAGLGNTFENRPSAMAAIAPYVNGTSGISVEIVKTACTHLGFECTNIDTRFELVDDFYISGGRIFEEFIKKENWVLMDHGVYVKYLENIPVAMFNIHSHPTQNYWINAYGYKAIIEKFEKVIVSAIRAYDDTTGRQRKFVMELADYDGRDNPEWVYQEIYRDTVIKNEYYPFIEHSVETLMRNFLEGEENAMIWYGPPGTGKSSAIRGLVDTLNILPVVAIKASVFQHRNFLRDIFAYSDEKMREHALSEKIINASGINTEEKEIILPKSTISKHLKEKYNYDAADKNKSRVPVIVIEDSDLIISKRSDHNSLMAQMLNELDGISSNQNRKIIFTTNKTNLSHVDEALLRPGRCFEKIFFRNLTVAEAIVARKAAGLKDFEEMPTADMSLATALVKPRPRFSVDSDGRFFTR